MKRKPAAIEIQSGRKVEQEWRIVRVSRLTGGKDRHSKVLTSKGLRDRRVRLSVPTAFQLYNLQERLGYEQPSKAVEWLIKAAKSAIDELPVLDSEMASASAGNVAHLTSSISSIVEHCAGSPGVFSLPLEPQSNNDDSPCGIHTHILSGTGNVQKLWNYNNMPSYTDMLSTQDSHPLQNMPSPLTEALQKSFQPVTATLASSRVFIESPCLQSNEMADSAKQSRDLGVNAEQGRANIPDMIMKSGEQQQQQQAHMHFRHYASTFVPLFSSNANCLASSPSSRGTPPSISSSIANIHSLSHIHKDSYGEASANDFFPFQEYDGREYQEFH
jgi:hypothetical protein